jgi:thiamine biosynthesis lipoprotein
MRITEQIMGMPVTVDVEAPKKVFEKVFNYFKFVDEKFSPYKQNSEVTKINDKRLKPKDLSDEMKLIIKLSKETQKLTDGYFNIYTNDNMDPSGIVKGWAIFNAGKIIEELGYKSYLVEAGGDIQTKGLNKDQKKWAIGIKNPFNTKEVVKVIYLSGEGVATSGTYERGKHIINPKEGMPADDEIVSLTVIGENVYEADRFATAAFAMGKRGINFIERLKGFEGYIINKHKIATMTSGFEKYVKEN